MATTTSSISSTFPEAQNNNEQAFSDNHLTKKCSGRHKTRLLIGEGNFSYAWALINKHDSKAKHSFETSLGHAVIATELQEKISCVVCERLHFSLSLNENSENSEQQDLPCDECAKAMEERTERIKELRERGVKILFGIDGTNIHETFKGERISRIHWNCPHDGSNFHNQTLPPIIKKFFVSCAKIQQLNDRVHMALVEQPFYQGYVYNIFPAVLQAGYVLIKKRRFDVSRYKEYKHMRTKRSSAGVDKKMYEFIFQKVDINLRQICKETKNKNGKVCFKKLNEKLVGFSPKKYTIEETEFYQKAKTYFSCKSDSDSSDCEEIL